MIKFVKNKYAVACIAPLVSLLVLWAGFELGIKNAKETLWEDHFVAEMGIQTRLLEVLNSLRSGQNEEAIKMIEIELYMLTAMLPYSLEGDPKETNYYAQLKDNMIQVKEYLDKYNVYGKTDKLSHYLSARKSVEDFLKQ